MDCPIGDGQSMVLLEDLHEMSEVRITVGLSVQSLNHLPCLLRHRSCRLATLVPMAEERQVPDLVPCCVLQKRLTGTPKLRSSPPDGRVSAAKIDNLLGYTILLLFIGPQFL